MATALGLKAVTRDQYFLVIADKTFLPLTYPMDFHSPHYVNVAHIAGAQMHSTCHVLVLFAYRLLVPLLPAKNVLSASKNNGKLSVNTRPQSLLTIATSSHSLASLQRNDCDWVISQRTKNDA